MVRGRTPPASLYFQDPQGNFCEFLALHMEPSQANNRDSASLASKVFRLCVTELPTVNSICHKKPTVRVPPEILSQRGDATAIASRVSGALGFAVAELFFRIWWLGSRVLGAAVVRKPAFGAHDSRRSVNVFYN